MADAFYEFEILENLLWIQSWGAWDHRVAQAFGEEARNLVLAHFAGKPWAILHDARQWELGTPEIEAVISGLMTTRLTGTLTHHAFVSGASQMKLWQIGRITAPVTSFEHRIFQEIDEAEAWLAAAGYTRP